MMLMMEEFLLSAEVSQASFTPGTLSSMMIDHKHEAVEVPDPGQVLQEVEEVDLLQVTLADEELNPSLPIVVEEGEDVDAESQLLLQLRHLIRRYWILQLIQAVLREVTVVVAGFLRIVYAWMES